MKAAISQAKSKRVGNKVLTAVAVMDRRFVILGAVLIQLALGAIYAWSVFTPSLIKSGWSKEQTQWVFAVSLLSFALTMVFAGKKLASWGPQKLTILGGLVLGAGTILGGLIAGTNFTLIILFIGLISGMGIGLAYVVPIAVGIRWYPDKKGLITGIAVAGFGFGALLWIKLAGSWGHLIASQGLSKTFVIYGVAYAAMILLGSIWMKYPPKGWKPEGFIEHSEDQPKTGMTEFSSIEMLKSSQFYLIFLTFAVSAGAGLMSIGLMKLYPTQALIASGLSETAALAAAGTAMAVFFSLANGIGRIAWGAISDRIGRKNSILIMTLTQGILIILFRYMAGNIATLYLAAALIGFNFGGNFALFPTITSDTFGRKSVGSNYPFVFLAYGIGGVLGPILGGKLGDMGNFPLAFSISGVAVLIGTILIFFVHPPKKPNI